MATKKTIPSMDISGELLSMNGMNGTSQVASSKTSATESASDLKPLKELPVADTTNYIPTAAKKTTKKAKKVNDDSALIGFRIPKAAKDQYIEFFSQYGMNLSEATKNALEYFIQDLVAEKVKITLTHHFERVEE